MMFDENHFQETLQKRRENGNFRSLKPKEEGIDFYSNDYLGLAGNTGFRNILLETVTENPGLLTGSTGSRLISGNSLAVEETETFIAQEHQCEAALLFPSGYNANLALFSTLPTRHDAVIVDEKVHRSVHDACKLSNAKKLKFRHNDCCHLEQILERQTGPCYIAIESLYSMDGDVAPVKEIAGIAGRYNARLIVDEAHAFGVFGYGLVDRYRLQNQVAATVITYGKALGAHGAAVLTNNLIRSYLVNFASPFIYTTAAQDFLWMSIRKGYEFLKANHEISGMLQYKIGIFREAQLEGPSAEDSPVRAVMVPDNDRLKNLHHRLLKDGFLTYAVCSPTVKPGTERLRICLHSFNTDDDIRSLTGLIKEFFS